MKRLKIDLTWTLFVIGAILFVILASYQMLTWHPHDDHIEHNPPSIPSK